jgi:putative transposase
MTLTLTEQNGIYKFTGRTYKQTEEKNSLLLPLNKMISNYGLQLVLLPTTEQMTMIDKTIGCARVVANNYLAVKDCMWKECGETVSKFEYRTEYYPILCEEFPWLKECHQASVLSGSDNMDKSFNNFFTGQSRYPKEVSRSKPNGQRYSTPNDHGSIHIDIINNLPYISIPKVGKVRFVLPKNRTISSIIPDENTRITSITVVHNSTECYVSLQMETIVNLVSVQKSVCRSHIGSMDMGLKDFGIYGDTENTLKVDNPRWIKKSERKLRRAQKSLSRKYEAAKKDGRNWWEGKNYQKAKAKVAKIHAHIANQRKDFHHKLSRIIVDTYDAFIFENLNIKGLLKNHRLAKSISSVGWYQFQQFVKYKLERKGGSVLKVDRFFASSKTCNKCGYKKEDLQLSDRYWYCPKCHTLHDRDINAKDNILAEGIRIMESSGYTILPA